MHVSTISSTYCLLYLASMHKKIHIYKPDKQLRARRSRSIHIGLKEATVMLHANGMFFLV